MCDWDSARNAYTPNPVRCMPAKRILPQRETQDRAAGITFQSQALPPKREDPSKHISMQTICRGPRLDRTGMMKIDIEDYEKDIFQEPERLAVFDNISMEVHPQMAGDLSLLLLCTEAIRFPLRYY